MFLPSTVLPTLAILSPALISFILYNFFFRRHKNVIISAFQFKGRPSCSLQLCAVACKIVGKALWWSVWLGLWVSSLGASSLLPRGHTSSYAGDLLNLEQGKYRELNIVITEHPIGQVLSCCEAVC